ncbi:unnamed protein product [Acanthoscelides obtectus]|uniref:Uncharacterized protein n=1 Tax=Acanthoscelides obtectus TaxID=200917 RepID=A0A9P0KGB6_ACAOB|nr:unnamed protein product [Acanthoscelides obtectus]CAK1648169.1 Sjoegren syndrome nuclear autoantigen 1 homolog [Acanthoscelides obtectus]
MGDLTLKCAQRIEGVVERKTKKRELETEMERITYKLCLLNKSLAQRINAKTCYDKTLEEMEEKYANLVKDSAELLKYIREEFGDLESMLNKKTSTDEGPTGGYVVDTQASGERGKTCKCKPLREKLIPDRYIEKDESELRVQAHEEEVAKFEFDLIAEQPMEKTIKSTESPLKGMFEGDVTSYDEVMENDDSPKSIDDVRRSSSSKNHSRRATAEGSTFTYTATSYAQDP